MDIVSCSLSSSMSDDLSTGASTSASISIRSSIIIQRRWGATTGHARARCSAKLSMPCSRSLGSTRARRWSSSAAARWRARSATGLPTCSSVLGWESLPPQEEDQVPGGFDVVTLSLCNVVHRLGPTGTPSLFCFQLSYLVSKFILFRGFLQGPWGLPAPRAHIPYFVSNVPSCSIFFC